MRAQELRERLLVALYVEAKKTGFGEMVDAAQLADAFGLERMPGQLRLAVQALEARAFISATYMLGDGDDGGLWMQLSNDGVEEAEELLDQHPEYANVSSPTSVPASDRYVALSDNQRNEVTNSVIELRSAVASANHVEDEDRQIALSEIAVFEVTITQSHVSAELVERFVKKILAWIRKTFGEALVGAIAGALIAKLLPFLAV